MLLVLLHLLLLLLRILTQSSVSLFFGRTPLFSPLMVCSYRSFQTQRHAVHFQNRPVGRLGCRKVEPCLSFHQERVQQRFQVDYWSGIRDQNRPDRGQQNGKSANLGHCRSGALSEYRVVVLPGCRRSTVGVRRNGPQLVQPCPHVVEGGRRKRREGLSDYAGGEQNRSERSAHSFRSGWSILCTEERAGLYRDVSTGFYRCRDGIPTDPPRNLQDTNKEECEGRWSR